MSATTATTIRLEDIDADESLQSRAKMNDEAIKDYADKYRNGTEMPPVIIFCDGKRNWLAGGFHRAIAAAEAGLSEINADVRQGGKDDALLYAVASNHDNGVQRTIADKRRAVEMVLAHEKFRKKPVNEIAKMCRVSRTLVETVISSILPESKIPTAKEVTRNGTTYEMQTANIGKPKDEPTPTPEESRPADDGDDAEAVDVGEADEPAAYDELDHDEETPGSFSDEPPPPNALGAFRTQLESMVRGFVVGRPSFEVVVVIDFLNDLVTELERDAE